MHLDRLTNKRIRRQFHLILINGNQTSRLWHCTDMSIHKSAVAFLDQSVKCISIAKVMMMMARCCRQGHKTVEMLMLTSDSRDFHVNDASSKFWFNRFNCFWSVRSSTLLAGPKPCKLRWVVGGRAFGIKCWDGTLRAVVCVAVASQLAVTQLESSSNQPGTQ